ncbi:MAG TPA: DUF192 domain-containing protein [Chlamydiales bacterium]|nr:DUF192 domain-containing protein [Chlamydiales bacterium]
MLFAILFALLPMKALTLGGETIQVEIADTQEARSKGLMGRESLPENTGMLFIFPKPLVLSFWMKNTLIPLSIGFFNEKKELFQITEMPVPKKDSLPPLFYSSQPAIFALEMPKKWFQEHQISEGMKFSFLDHSP